MLKRGAAPAGFLAGLTFCGVAIYAHSFSWTAKPIQTVGSLAANFVMAALIAHCATSHSGMLVRSLKTRMLTAYGKYSYGMYVYHPVVFTLGGIPELRLLRHTPPAFGLLVSLPTLVLVQVALYFLARFSWNHFESPLLKYKARFTEPLPTGLKPASS